MNEEDYISYQSRLEAIISGTNAGTWEWNAQTGNLIINKRWAEMMGYQVQELEPLSIQTWLDLVHPNDLQQANQLVDNYLAGNTESYNCIVRMRHKKGHWVVVQDSGKIVTYTSDGKPEWLAGTHIDVTNHYNAELVLNKISQRLPCAIFSMQIDHNGLITLPFVSEQINNFHQISVDDLKLKPEKILGMVHKEDMYAFLRSLKISHKKNLPWMMDFRLNNAEAEKWLQIHAIPEVSEQGLTWYGVINDINRQKSLERQLMEQALLDELTQLPNRRVLIARLCEMIKLISRRQQHISVVVIDLDKFKNINDIYGHVTGDKVLVKFANILKNRLRETDVFGRFGGEEFLILMPDTDAETAYTISKVLLADWTNQKLVSESSEVFTSTFSAGITEISITDDDFNKVVARADDAMYEAKDAGRNRVRVFQDTAS